MDTLNSPTIRKKLQKLSSQDPGESRYRWRHVTEALSKKDVEAASEGKHMVSLSCLRISDSPIPVNFVSLRFSHSRVSNSPVPRFQILPLPGSHVFLVPCWGMRFSHYQGLMFSWYLAGG